MIRVHLLSSFYIPERHPWGGVPFPLIQGALPPILPRSLSQSLSESNAVTTGGQGGHHRWARWDFRGTTLPREVGARGGVSWIRWARWSGWFPTLPTNRRSPGTLGARYSGKSCPRRAERAASATIPPVFAPLAGPNALHGTIKAHPHRPEAALAEGAVL